MRKVFYIKRIVIIFLLAMTVSKSGFCSVANIYFPGSPFSVCGTQVENHYINVVFTMCESGGTCNYTVCNNDPLFQATIALYKNGNLYATHISYTSTPYLNEIFPNVPMTGGNTFYANVKFERKRNICALGYETIANVTSSISTIAATPATPNFNINGVAVPANYVPMEVCGSNIKLNAASTTCETAYNITVEECDQWLNRTFQYEFSKWFNGQAPDSINLQLLAAQTSVPPYFTGDVARQGDILFGGNLPSGAARYYRVKVCTGIPSWNCKTALVKVLDGCKPEREEMQEYGNVAVQEGKIEVLTLSSNDGATSIVKNLSNRVNVYPNPTTDEVSFHVTAAAKDMVTISVYDIKGKRVLDVVNNILATDGENVYQARLGSLQTGMYFYKIKTNNTTYNGKLIKK
jgi:hypothetical protein